MTATAVFAVEGRGPRPPSPPPSGRGCPHPHLLLSPSWCSSPELLVLSRVIPRPFRSLGCCRPDYGGHSGAALRGRTKCPPSVPDPWVWGLAAPSRARDGVSRRPPPSERGLLLAGTSHTSGRPPPAGRRRTSTTQEVQQCYRCYWQLSRREGSLCMRTWRRFSSTFPSMAKRPTTVAGRAWPSERLSAPATRSATARSPASYPRRAPSSRSAAGRMSSAGRSSYRPRTPARRTGPSSTGLRKAPRSA